MRRAHVKQETILVAESEQALCETIAYHLRREGHVVRTAHNGRDALEVARQSPLDLALLDLLLPAVSGLEVCRQVHAIPEMASLPIILLLPRQAELTSEEERGAADSLVKPFSWKELRALVRATLRRSGEGQRGPWLHAATPEEEQRVYVVGDLQVDVNRREVTRHGRPIELTARLFDLLVYLIRYPDTVLTYDRLLAHVWGSPVKEQSKTLYVHIRWLREKLEDDPSHPGLIETVYGIGYRFNAAAAQASRKETRCLPRSILLVI